MNTTARMEQPADDGAAAHSEHVDRLAADTDDLVAMLTRHHAAGGDLHPEALDASTRLAASVRDLQAMLSRNHDASRDDGAILH